MKWTNSRSWFCIARYIFYELRNKCNPLRTFTFVSDDTQQFRINAIKLCLAFRNEEKCSVCNTARSWKKCFVVGNWDFLCPQKYEKETSKWHLIWQNCHRLSQCNQYKLVLFCSWSLGQNFDLQSLEFRCGMKWTFHKSIKVSRWDDVGTWDISTQRNDCKQNYVFSF